MDESGATLKLVWTEQDGPRVPSFRKDGFGSAMMAQAAVQIGGRLERDWQSDGVRVTLEFRCKSSGRRSDLRHADPFDRIDKKYELVSHPPKVDAPDVPAPIAMDQPGQSVRAPPWDSPAE